MMKIYVVVYGLRRPKFLSPTSLSQFYSNPDEFFLQRLCTDVPKQPQTIPMAIGSAFDAHVKAYLHEVFIGGHDPEYELNSMLNGQVELGRDAIPGSPDRARRDYVIKAGQYAFHCYKRSGALASLMQDLGMALIGSIKMEKTVTATIQGVPLLGKPDLCFRTACGSGSGNPISDAYGTPGSSGLATFILDWKVNGFMSTSTTSPKKGYSMIRDGWDESIGVHSRSHGKSHKDFMLHNVCGIPVNGMVTLEQVDASWAAQVVTYAWALGDSVGGAIHCGIDQLACRQLVTKDEEVIVSSGYMAEIRVASFRMAVGKAFQLELIEKYKKLWSVLSMDDEHLMDCFYNHVGYDAVQSRSQCQLMLNMAEQSTSPREARDDFFDSMTGGRAR